MLLAVCRKTEMIMAYNSRQRRSALIILNQHASSCLLTVQWTVPPYEVFRFAFPSISTSVLFHFPLSSVYCNVLNIRNVLPFSVLMHFSFCFTTYYVKLYLMEVMFSSLCCKFIIGQLFEIVNTFLKKNIKKYLNKQKEKKSLKIDRGKHKVMTALRRFIVISVL